MSIDNVVIIMSSYVISWLELLRSVPEYLVNLISLCL